MPRPKVVDHGWTAWIEAWRHPSGKYMATVHYHRSYKREGWKREVYTVVDPRTMRRKMWKRQARFDMKWLLEKHRAMGF